MRYFLPLGVALALAACGDRTEVTAPEQSPEATNDEAPTVSLDVSRDRAGRSALSGGATTVFDISSDAFSQVAPNLTGLSLARHDAGDEAFEDVFTAPGGGANPGLGPVFDNVSCEACHIGDGRGRPPVGAEIFESLLFRASLPGLGPQGGPKPVPGFGGQLQLRSIPGFAAEVSASIRYRDSTSRFADGTTYTLQVPIYSIIGVRSRLPRGTLTSPRVAPPVFGLGLLEAVTEGEILTIAALQARNRGPVSGRPNYVWDAVRQRTAIGRFGWKANVSNLIHQTAGAYNGDMGVTSSLFPAESCEGVDPACDRHPIEVSDETVANVAHYTRTLGVPARRDLDNPVAQRGEQIFQQSGCTSCHVATLQTGVLAGVPEVSNQRIHPYTDLLVHDMGEALADNRPDFQASGREWRTPPLWGIGLVQTVNGHSRFLHDGRARSLLEAVLWHGGEATDARERVRRLPGRDRAALVAFLSSL